VTTSPVERYVTYAVLALFASAALAPLLGVILAAMHPSGALLSGVSLPHSLSFETFRTAWDEGHFGRLMASSMIVAVAVVALTSVLSIPAGFAFGTMRFPGSNALFYLILIGIVVPFESLIVPLYYAFRDHGLTDSYWGLIWPQTALSVSFGTFWMRAFFRSVPPELADAARVDGATSWRILWRVLVPIGRPAILTMVLLVFMWTWNEFLLALVMISDESHRTAPLGLSAFQSRYGVDIPGVSAAAVFVAAPVVILYILLQRQFLRGMLAGSLKG
jgi:raffinose/stachyose/melibiose transport system permease protein